MKQKCMSGGRKPPHRSDRYWNHIRGAWLARHPCLDRLIGFFLGYEVRGIKFQRRPTNGISKTESQKDEANHQGRR